MTKNLKEQSLMFHSSYPRGKINMNLSKNIENVDDLSLAYTPGVAEVCKQIIKNSQHIYTYTNKGNLVSVVTNGTAVLGMGNIGVNAAKPVMEGKCAIFKRFANIDSIDIGVDEEDPQKFIDIILKISNTWGGINLEDIKSPECFEIESQLKSKLEIPVFHDDQHGTAIVTTAALINALYLSNKKISDIKVVFSGAGAAALACVKMFIKLGVFPQNIIVCDSLGVIYKGRSLGLDRHKLPFAINTFCRTLAEAIVDADVFVGLSSKNVLSQDMVKSMSSSPIIFAMANPDPEILPETVYNVSSNAIVATGRSDFLNQINNAICFPYIFRGAMDVRAITINDEMKISVIHSLVSLARKPLTKKLYQIYGKNNAFDKNYLIPSMFDSRLLLEIPYAVAKSAILTGASRKKMSFLNDYRKFLISLSVQS